MAAEYTLIDFLPSCLIAFAWIHEAPPFCYSLTQFIKHLRASGTQLPHVINEKISNTSFPRTIEKRKSNVTFEEEKVSIP